MCKKYAIINEFVVLRANLHSNPRKVDLRVTLWKEQPRGNREAWWHLAQRGKGNPQNKMRLSTKYSQKLGFCRKEPWPRTGQCMPAVFAEPDAYIQSKSAIWFITSQRRRHGRSLSSLYASLACWQQQWGESSIPLEDKVCAENRHTAATRRATSLMVYHAYPKLFMNIHPQ